ncbi:14499_t:CDS:1, partial [Funneliformis caledonium]
NAKATKNAIPMIPLKIAITSFNVLLLSSSLFKLDEPVGIVLLDDMI